MNKGDLRKSILYGCPEDFTDELSSYIDDIESTINEVLDDIETSGLSDADGIDDAVGKLQGLSNGLY